MNDLTESQTEELRALLETLRLEVERELQASTADARPVDLGLSIGRLSRMDALQQQHMALARRQRVQVRLQQIRAALEHIESGSYGACALCGEAIGFARLRARPEAQVCRECQSGQGQ